MSRGLRSRGATVFLSSLLIAGTAAAAEEGGRLVGWVEDARGTPVPGAVISLFGKGLTGGGVVTFTDNTGRFLLPALPAGSYTLRALGGRLRAPARQITVLPNTESIFSVNLSADASEEEERDQSPRARELRWLLRHKRRSVLEARGPEAVRGPETTLADRSALWLPEVDGTFEVVTTPAALGVDVPDLDGVPTRYGAMRLSGRFAGVGRWSLGGLVAESEATTWRMAAEFVVEPGGGHEIQAGTGYGSRILRGAPGADEGRQDERSVGAIFIQDRWEISPSLEATVGARYSYIGFVEDTNTLDPMGSIQYTTRGGARIRAMASTRTLAPGGDLLTLSTLASTPAIALAVMEGGVRPERLARYELAIERDFGGATLATHAFYEGVDDQLVNSFEGPAAARALRISNGRRFSARGASLSVARRVGKAFRGSLAYTYGRSWREDPSPGRTAPGVQRIFEDNDFHDVVARVETFVDWTDTRLVALYRVNTWSPLAEGPGTQGVTNTRFDVQLKQGLPFLGALTRADWELLLAYRNLFYETDEGGTLDELLVTNPPSRVLGGITVRF